jgi:hypothetical protein
VLVCLITKEEMGEELKCDGRVAFMCADVHASAVVRMALSECECTEMPYSGAGCALNGTSPVVCTSWY